MLEAGPRMSDPIELCNNARACLRFAEAATVESDKEVMLLIATAWLKLAQQWQEFRSASDAAEPAPNV